VDEYAKVAKVLGPFGIPIALGFGIPAVLEWLPAFWERGALGRDRFKAVMSGEVDHRPMIDFCREHDILCACMGPPPTVTKDGPISAIEEEMKKRCEYGKSHTKFATGIAAVDYITPQANFEAAIAAAKRYGKIS